MTGDIYFLLQYYMIHVLFTRYDTDTLMPGHDASHTVGPNLFWAPFFR